LWPLFTPACRDGNGSFRSRMRAHIGSMQIRTTSVLGLIRFGGQLS
jgi:hypothetical protein